MKKYALKNLDCASCALKIEQELNSKKYVKSAKVNFATTTLTIDTDDINQVKRDVDSIEPGVSLSETKLKHDGFSVKSELVQLMIYISAFFVAVYISDYTPNKNIGLALLVIIYILAGWSVIFSALKKIATKDMFDENFLMTFATIAAFAIGAYTESVAVMLFYRAGEFFQGWAVNSTRRSISALVASRPNVAYIKEGGSFVEKSPDDVVVGDILQVRVGEKIALDGIVIKGETSLDTSALTGESMPKAVKIDDNVLSGMMNLSNVIEVRVTNNFAESSISKVIDMVENATENKSKTENFITTFAKVYTPIIVLISLLVAVIPPMLNFGTFSEWIYRALVVLVVSCPCALIISVPLAYFGGLGGASRRGVLIKGANYLEALSNITAIGFDKTGTLTKGKFAVSEIIVREGYTEGEVLKYAAIAEKLSTHPIGSAIRNAYGESLDDVEFESYGELAGIGVEVSVGNDTILVGNAKLLKTFNIDLAAETSTTAYVIVNNKFIGSITVSDELKNDTAEALSKLASIGVESVAVFTGDNKISTEKIIGKVGITDYFTNLMPADKVNLFKSFMGKQKGKTAYVGDGINDAPVLALADVGVSMGKLGSELAIETADVVIMNDSLMKLVDAIKLAKRTKVIIWQNILFALGVKAIFIVLGLFGVASMWEAVFGDIGVALLALFNSLRVLK